MLFPRFFGVCLWMGMWLCACSGSKPGTHGDSPSPVKPADLQVPAPTTYCEKVWSCSYEELVSDEARMALIQKRRAFVTSCEEALRKMPGDFIQKHERCTGMPCGEELQRCLLDAKPETRGAKP